MPSSPEKAPRSVEDFIDFLRSAEHAGIEFAIIGGCAVGVYARLRGETVVSADLDIYVRETTLPELLAWAESQGAVVVSRPQPRTVPVAVFTWRGEEVNVLTASTGLPPADAVLRSAREFELKAAKVKVLVADPLDVLANKLAIDREKDRPHIELLKRFVYDEVATSFRGESAPREALEPARRLMSVLGIDTLPEELESLMVESAADPVRRRFLMHRVASRDSANRLLGAADSPKERSELQSILATRKNAPPPEPDKKK